MVLRDALAENFACFAYSAVSGSRRLRLPSVWWRLATLTTIIALLGSDPKLDFWSARAQGTFPRNDSTDTTRITELAYNLDGHLAQVNCPEGVINYGYDLATGRHSSTCTTNSEVAYGYDALGRLKTVSLLKRNGTSLVNPEVTTYTYTAVGNRETITLPNGTVTRYQYDSLSRLTNLTHTATNGTLLASYSYQLHATGRRTGALEVLRDAGTNTYTTNLLVWAYDGMYRLTNEVSSSTATFGTYTNAYLYDQVGNRLKKIRMASSGTNTVDYGYNDNDQLLDEVSRLNDSITTNSYAYDDNGSLTGKATNGVTVATYAYNLANKMKSVTANLITTAFHYNDQGIRVRSIASDVKHYLLDANNHTGYAQVLEEFNAAGSAPTLAMSYVLGDDVVGQCGTGTSDPRWLLYDGHGSTRQLVRNSSDVASQFHYDGYGTSLTPLPGSADTRLLYCGEEYDTTLEMYNLRARYYDQNSARFNQRDTYLGTSSDPLSLHK